MELREALSQIAAIRQQMACVQMYRGYRAAPTAFSSTVALGAGAMQHWWAPDPQRELMPYLLLWTGAAAISIIVFSVGIVARYRRAQAQLQRDLTMLAIEQFLPCVVAGAALTAVLARFAPAAAWMLPGLWCILFSMGVFASRRMLPAAVSAVAAFYLLSGLLQLALAQGEGALSPWAMALPFGIGQLLGAAVLYWNLERRHGQEQE